MHTRRLLRISMIVSMMIGILLVSLALLFNPARRVAIASDPYWSQLFWQEGSAALRLRTVLLNRGRSAEFIELGPQAGAGELLDRLGGTAPHSLILSPQFASHARALAEELTETRIIALDLQEAGGANPDTAAQHGRIVRLSPELEGLFYRAGQAEARALRDAPAERLHDAEPAPEEWRVVHLWHASSLVQERHLDALRRGLRAGGWQGAVEALSWPPEEENRQLGEILNGTSGKNSEEPMRTRFLGIYCGVAAAEALQFAHREGIPAAVMGPELRKAYPETVRFSLELEWYAALRKAVWRSLQGEELPPRQPVEGRIVTH